MTAPTPRAYRLLSERFGHPAGTLVYEQMFHDYGLASDDTRATGVERWCADNGYSVGAAQRGDPRAIMRGDMDIAKWRNLSAAQQIECDGVMTGDQRFGPVTIEIFDAEGA